MRSPARILIGLGAAAALALAVGATTASASASVAFQTPSKNVGCMGTATMVRCDVRHTSGRLPAKPRSCRFDWGHGFGLTRTGRGRVLCVSDTTLNPRARVLAYGRAIRVNPRITCTSRRAGLTCVNRRGHGFTLARERVRLF